MDLKVLVYAIPDEFYFRITIYVLKVNAPSHLYVFIMFIKGPTPELIVFFFFFSI